MVRTDSQKPLTSNAATVEVNAFSFALNHNLINLTLGKGRALCHRAPSLGLERCQECRHTHMPYLTLSPSFTLPFHLSKGRLIFYSPRHPAKRSLRGQCPFCFALTRLEREVHGRDKTRFYEVDSPTLITLPPPPPPSPFLSLSHYSFWQK